MSTVSGIDSLGYQRHRLKLSRLLLTIIIDMYMAVVISKAAPVYMLECITP